MIQLTFAFNRESVFGQMELFSEEFFDNRVKRLDYAIRLSHNIEGWRPYSVDRVKECVKLFGVNHQTVFESYSRLLCQLQSKWESLAA